MRPVPPGFDPEVWTLLEHARGQLANDDVPGALETYALAWERCIAAADHYHAGVVAHMAGVVEPEATRKHEWNLRALAEADAVADRERVKQTYASNLNNVATSYALLGYREKAIESWRAALACLVDVSPGPYADQVCAGIERNLARFKEGER